MGSARSELLSGSSSVIRPSGLHATRQQHFLYVVILLLVKTNVLLPPPNTTIKRCSCFHFQGQIDFLPCTTIFRTSTTTSNIVDCFFYHNDYSTVSLPHSHDGCVGNVFLYRRSHEDVCHSIRNTANDWSNQTGPLAGIDGWRFQFCGQRSRHPATGKGRSEDGSQTTTGIGKVE